MAKRRRIPWWVVMLAFAIFTGATIGGLAYLRRPQRTDCVARTPRASLVQPLVEYGSTYGKAVCEIRFRRRAAADAPVELLIISQRHTAWNTRVAELGAKARVHAVGFRKPHASGSYVTLDDKLVLVMPGTEGEAIEIHVAHGVLGGEAPFEIADDIAARL